MDLATILPIFIALVTGGGVAIYTARPRKDSIIAEAAEKAVSVVSAAMKNLEESLAAARERIAVLEEQKLQDAATLAACMVRISALRDAVVKLGGDVEQINRVGKRGPAGEKGPPGDKGAPGDSG